MSKKDFTGGLSSLLGEIPEKTTNRGRPKVSTKITAKASEEGTKPGETRATFIVSKEILDKLKAMAYWDRMMIKDVVNNALEGAIANYEKKNGVIKPIPTKNK